MSRCYVNITLCIGLFVGFACFEPASLQAQDPQFSQFFATRIYMNPAFAGNTHFGRFSTHLRRQWPALQGYTSSGMYYDQSLPAINSGIGISLFQDRHGGGGVVSNKYSGYYSYRFNATRKLSVKFGIAGSYNSFNINLGRFTFTDQLISGASSTSDDFRFDRLQYFDVNTGLVAFTERYWGGISLSNLNNFSRVLDNPFPVKLSVHGGLLIPINKDIKGEFLKNVTIAAQYKTQQDFDQFDIGVYYGYSVVLVGIWYRGLLGLKDNVTTVTNQDAVILVAGLQFGAFRMSYSYDISASTLHTYSYGAHEVSLQVELWRNFNYKKKRFSRRNVPCPNFGGPGWQTNKD
ncbi:MAG: type IX secretion system membrane protein PorP/SprF [Cryomorphaceae bacterium]